MTEPDNPGLPFAPPFSFIVPFLAALVLEWFVPTHLVGGIARWAGGLAFLVAGLALVLGGALTQRRAGTDFLPHRPTTRVVAHGVYGWTRNPMYVGFALWTISLALLSDTAWGLLALPIGLVIADRVIVAREERYLERKFGAEYLAYKSRVRRWL